MTEERGGDTVAEQPAVDRPEGLKPIHALRDAAFKHSFDATHALAALESENMKLLECAEEQQAALQACVTAAHDEVVEDFSRVSNAADAALACIHKWRLP